MSRRRPSPHGPIRHPRSLVRLWPRTRPINRHAVARALYIAAWGSHVCRPFPNASTPELRAKLIDLALAEVEAAVSSRSHRCSYPGTGGSHHSSESSWMHAIDTGSGTATGGHPRSTGLS